MIAYISALLLSLSTLSAVDFNPPAPDFVEIGDWFNSEPLSLEKLRGKVVLVDFWTYSYINCIRELPHLNQLYAEYKDKGLVIVGVHSPEFTFEHDTKNIQKAIQRFKIHFPVAVDTKYGTWKAYNNHFWPASYLIDQKGNIRLRTTGEGHYDELESEIRKLLGLSPKSLITKELPDATGSLTPETYLGFHRAEGYTKEMALKPQVIEAYSYSERLADDQVGLKGRWLVEKECIEAKNAACQIDLNFQAGRVYLVLSGSSSKPITVTLDGKPLEKKYYTQDMNDHGEIYVHEARKYDLVDLHGSVERHLLSVHIPEGICAYAFTFGRTL